MLKDNLLLSAIESHLRNEFQQALNLYCECIRVDYRSSHARLYLGILLIQNGFADEGLQLIELSKHDPACSRLVLENINALRSSYLARLSMESGQFNAEEAVYPQRNLGTVDDWRHLKMLSFVKAFRSDGGRWLTVGDHFGHDALRIKEIGIDRVVPSSLSLEYLNTKEAAHCFDETYQINAESIDLEDDSFDYIVCKEALHHMARPYLAIYEMLRVAKRAVIVVAEPCDPIIDWHPEDKPRTVIRHFSEDPMVGPEVSYMDQAGNLLIKQFTDWWETGPYNYVYTFSDREFAKISRGYGVLAFATRQENDFYSEEIANAPAQDGDLPFEYTKDQISRHNALCNDTGIPSSRISAIFFREPPREEVRNLLEGSGFRYQTTRTRFLPLTWPRDLRFVS